MQSSKKTINRKLSPSYKKIVKKDDTHQTVNENIFPSSKIKKTSKTSKRYSLEESSANKKKEASHKKHSSMLEKEIKEITDNTKKISVSSELIKKVCAMTKAGKGEDGMTKVNQDTYISIEKLFELENFNVFSVLDGHGMYGHLISQFVSTYFSNHIQKHKKLRSLQTEEEMYAVIKKNNYDLIEHLYTHAEKDLMKSEIDANFSGTTCVTVFQLGNKLICANVGDSRAILVKQNQIIQMSIDQKPNDKTEEQRIIKCGGEISQYEEDGVKSGPFRVWKKGEMYPGIAMSRSIGDLIATTLGVIPNPVFTEFEIDLECKYIIMASDGVWEFLDNEAVKKLVQPYYVKNDPDGACKALIKESTKWWEKEDVVVDDITVIAIFF